LGFISIEIKVTSTIGKVGGNIGPVDPFLFQNSLLIFAGFTMVVGYGLFKLTKAIPPEVEIMQTLV